MARLTVEDCLQHVDNRFELILQASKRAREIIRGGDPLVPWDNDQATVVALREIADGLHLEENVKNKAAAAPAIMAVEDEETLEASSAESDENSADSGSATAEPAIGDGEDHPNKAEGDASEEEKGEEE